jgi:hypothetical protein
VWSGTTKFFIEMLSAFGSVSEFYPTKTNVEEVLVETLEQDFDLYVFYQFDFMAYAFVAAGKNVVIVPMVDGSSAFGFQHWNLLRGARVWSWSVHLHKFCTLIGLDSYHSKYWPKPAVPVEVNIEKYFYFWYRGQYSKWNLARIYKLLAENYPLYKIVIRDETKVGSFPKLKNVTVVSGLSRTQHLNYLLNCSAFIAPRPSEGLGFSFLEALEMGVPVIGYGYPTMNEYIIDNETGWTIKFMQKKSVPALDFIQMRKKIRDLNAINYSKFLSSLNNFDIMMDFSNHVLKKRLVKKNKVKKYDLIDYSVRIYKGETFPGGFKKPFHYFIMMKVLFNLIFRK